MGEPEARERILDAAEAAFARHGFAGARVAAISADAGVNKAMLYYYFDSKEGLHRAVLERVADRVLALAEQVLARGDAPPTERLRSFVEGYRSILLSRPRFPRVMMREFLDGGSRILPVLAPRMSLVARAFATTISQGQAQGAIHPGVDPALSLLVVLAPIAVFTNIEPFAESILGAAPGALRQRFRQTLLGILIEGLQARQPPEDPDSEPRP